MQIRTLSVLECTKILMANRVGRLACAKDGQPYVVPLYYAHSDAHLYAFSMPGKKIEWMRANPLVSVQVDEHGLGRGGEAWLPMADTKNCLTRSATSFSGTMPGRC